jgi:hypothetical protein
MHEFTTFVSLFTFRYAWNGCASRSEWVGQGRPAFISLHTHIFCLAYLTLVESVALHLIGTEISTMFCLKYIKTHFFTP